MARVLQEIEYDMQQFGVRNFRTIMGILGSVKSSNDKVPHGEKNKLKYTYNL